ncbi:hypothetical protein TNCV_3099241 [Trichonephila clavipes]|nr:hypothetical protein TNCV_3099241 [Trichonephila clavipes]
MQRGGKEAWKTKTLRRAKGRIRDRIESAQTRGRAKRSDLWCNSGRRERIFHNVGTGEGPGRFSGIYKETGDHVESLGVLESAIFPQPADDFRGHAHEKGRSRATPAAD